MICFKWFQGFKSLGYSFLLRWLFLGSCYFLWNFIINPLGIHPALSVWATQVKDEDVTRIQHIYQKVIKQKFYHSGSTYA